MDVSQPNTFHRRYYFFFEGEESTLEIAGVKYVTNAQPTRTRGISCSPADTRGIQQEVWLNGWSQYVPTIYFDDGEGGEKDLEGTSNKESSVDLHHDCVVGMQCGSENG